MAKFIFETLTQSMASYLAPSGIVYTIMIGQPFEVKDKGDIKFFEDNKRFKKVSVFTKVKADKVDPEEEFRNKLLEIEGLGEDTAEVVVDIYRSEKDFVEVITQKSPLDPCISKEEQELLVKAFMPEELQDEPVVEESLDDLEIADPEVVEEFETIVEESEELKTEEVVQPEAQKEEAPKKAKKSNKGDN